jgi:zinc protease
MMRNVIRALWILIASTLLCGLPVRAQKAVPLPELNTKRLLNDLHITVVPTPNFGENMTIGLVLRYGASFDPAEKGGMANLASRMFLRATGDKTAKGIQDELASLGATIEVQADWDGIRFVMTGQSSKYERSLLLLYQVVAEALFTDADFNVVKNSILSELRKAPDPRQRIHSQFEKALFSGTTYGRPIEGDVRTVSAITLGDLRYFYRKFFSPGQAALVVVGNVSAPTVFQRTGRIWGIWVRNDDVPFTFPAPRNPASKQIFLEDDPGSSASQFIMGNLFPRREDPAFTGALLAAHIFQERMTKLLPTSLVTVGYDGRRLSSPFYVQGQAAADQTLDQLQKMREAAEGMKNTPVSDEELDAAQRKVIEDFNRDLSTTAGICRVVLDSELYRLGNNYAVVFPDQIRRCDPDTVKNAASTWIFPGGEILLVRGPAATLKSALETLGSSKQQ